MYRRVQQSTFARQANDTGLYKYASPSRTYVDLRVLDSWMACIVIVHQYSFLVTTPLYAAALSIVIHRAPGSGARRVANAKRQWAARSPRGVRAICGADLNYRWLPVGYQGSDPLISALSTAPLAI
ncbi:conserved hypothetical protein [Trichinella spiralis]|uniref:hypothetical protein n=1 Tax=Trichinella spiralis TaxID=6334 RepID=UPI0001EFBB50|nr:conserved hypothetical protein [Trichinella spiralis]